MIDKVAVGIRIAALRKELGYSQAFFAEKLCVSTQAVSKWETGLSLPDIEVLMNISWITGASLHTLLEGEDFVEPYSGIDRGLSRISERIECPECHGCLKLNAASRDGKPRFDCVEGHSYCVEEGVLFFNTRELAGEMWSLMLRNYEHYLEIRRRAVNPRYLQGDPHMLEVMWRAIERLRPRTILDVASGMGCAIEYIVERVSWPITIITANLSHRILKWNNTFFREELKNPYAEMVYLACDCANLPLADGSVDVVFSNAGFESMQKKTMDGIQEAYRALKPGGYVVFNISAVDDHESENTQKWTRLMREAHGEFPDVLRGIDEWLAAIKDTGFRQSDAVKIYGEMPAPEGETFPFRNEMLQWMAEYVVVAQK